MRRIFQLRGHQLLVGTPLGIGKPNPLINALWAAAKSNPDVDLELFTALSLQLPAGGAFLQRRFLKHFIARYFCAYPELDYLKDIKSEKLPARLRVTEFYIQSGKMLRSQRAQRHYTSSNYTHVARDMVDRGVNVIVQMVGVDSDGNTPRYSLSCNPDLTLDVLRIAQEKNRPRPLLVGMVNPALPFMGGEAAVDEDFFDLLVDEASLYFEPFATPRGPVNAVDHSIGLQASALVQDGGTLQIGIGSLADAFVHATRLRQQNNAAYRNLLNDLDLSETSQAALQTIGATGVYSEGLYAASEMFVEGFAQLIDCGVLTRRVYDDAGIQRLLNRGALKPELPHNALEILLAHGEVSALLSAKELTRLQRLGVLRPQLRWHDGRIVDENSDRQWSADLQDPVNLKSLQQHALGQALHGGSVLHAAFLLGSRWFYRWLHALDEEKKATVQMTPVSRINELYGGEVLDRAQRVKARFINTCMKVDLLGAAASDGLANQQVVSGVGGQYNFVAMAHALSDSRSILMVRSTHGSGRRVTSNIVWQYPYCTIPRHLRDVVISEYGVADLRGQSDEVCIQRMIGIADARFQEELRRTAVEHGKLSPDWRIPAACRSNTPERLRARIERNAAHLPEYPFGHDFTPEEWRLVRALKWLQAHNAGLFSRIALVFKATVQARVAAAPEALLECMGLNRVSGLSQRVQRRLLCLALQRTKDPH